MIIARPMGYLRSILFIFLFTLSRVPALFLIATALIYRGLSLPQLILMLIMIFIARSYIESEITGGKMRYFMAFRVVRTIIPLLLLIILDIILIYYLLASPVTRLLIISATLLIVILFFDYHVSNGYYYGYRIPIGANIVLALLWLYLLLVPDSPFGKLTILVAIYIIEYYNLFIKERLNDFIH